MCESIRRSKVRQHFEEYTLNIDRIGTLRHDFEKN